MKLRKATISDSALLRHWDKQPHIIAAKGNEDWQWETEMPRNPEWRQQFIAEVNNHPIGFLQIIDAHEEETHYWGEVPKGFSAIDIWIGDIDYIGKGYGSQMMQQAIDRCFADPAVHAILVDPFANNKLAHKFYEKCGFEFAEQREFDGEKCFVFKLKRESYEHPG